MSLRSVMRFFFSLRFRCCEKRARWLLCRSLLKKVTALSSRLGFYHHFGSVFLVYLAYTHAPTPTLPPLTHPAQPLAFFVFPPPSREGERERSSARAGREREIEREQARERERERERNKVREGGGERERESAGESERERERDGEKARTTNREGVAPTCTEFSLALDRFIQVCVGTIWIYIDMCRLCINFVSIRVTIFIPPISIR